MVLKTFIRLVNIYKHLLHLLGVPDGAYADENQHSKPMPNLFELRQDPLIQEKVQQRPQELNQLVNTGDQLSRRGEGLMFWLKIL